MKYTVHKLANLSGVSVRALHYYDEIGLLHPAEVADNGYRYYSQEEILQLQQILFYRELDFSLEEIKEILLSPSFDRVTAFKDQEKLLQLKKKRLEKIITTIRKEIQQLEGGGIVTQKTDNIFDSLDDKKLKEYAQEAKKRWGHTDAYKQSAERTKQWTKEDYKRVEKEQTAITQDIAELMKEWVSVESSDVQLVVERHYQYINQFYDCSVTFYKNLGEMYVADPRFTVYYDKFAPHLAEFMKDAIAYYCKMHKK